MLRGGLPQLSAIIALLNPSVVLAGFERPWYATQALMQLALRAGSADVLLFVIEQLDFKHPDFRSLGVDVIANITGHDARRAPGRHSATARRRRRGVPQRVPLAPAHFGCLNLST